METQTESFNIEPLTKEEQKVFNNNIKQIEKENKEFMQEQANENISDLLLNKPRAKQIKKSMSEFVKELK